MTNNDFSKAHQSKSRSIRLHWERKKNKLRWMIAGIFAAINIIGILVATPGFSITTWIAESYIVPHADFVVLVLKHALEFTGHQNIDLNANAAPISAFIKYCIVILVTLVIVYVIQQRDPFSNESKLRNLAESPKPGIFRSWLLGSGELYFYANNAPSNFIPRICDCCGKKDECPSRIFASDAVRNERWANIFPILNEENIRQCLKCSYNCRKAFFLKYGFLYSAIFLSGIFLVYWYSAPHFDQSIQFNIPLFVLIVISSLGYIVASVANPWGTASTNDDSGAWGKFKCQINKLFASEDYIAAHEEKVCNPAEPGIKTLYLTRSLPDTTQDFITSELMTLEAIIKYLDSIVVNKGLLVIKNTDNHMTTRVDSIQKLLDNIVDLFEELYGDQHRFRVALLVLDDSGEHLLPVMCGQSAEAGFSTINTSEDTDLTIYREKFSLEGTSLAARAFTTSETVCRNSNIPYFYPQQENHLKSMCCIPILVDKLLTTVFNKFRLEYTQNVFGVLSLDCDSTEVFCTRNERRNSMIVKSFITRIIFEIALELRSNASQDHS